ncbi:glycosyltransferase family 2 protein [Nocardioides jishulii]|uniref:Glycosyltransferase family 2 protein n=1 Tax=Nocardioides jishulii TaxID=2575440 RepID=A0A4V5TLS7_9ACTN|nr:glycosyltransferase family 2 protein [Nocardioides jishulii]QCX28209.1 glycosyltransferase family 2 protein [Nocardioides jishulii]TKI60873.1 glycosyltransferase family 2 protein [Nocardioides jishulii]
MTVSAVLISHDGARWLPNVLEGMRSQHRPADRCLAVDTGSKDESRGLLVEAFGEDSVVDLPVSTSFPAAVRAALDALPPADEDEWIWLLHDDSAPDHEALAWLLAASQEYPDVEIFGPKLREWPSLRRLLELGVTISGTGRRETGLERGEYDQGQHDQEREVLAVNTAGMLVRRRVLEELGGFDERLPLFGNDVDFGWRAARAGHRTYVVPQAVVFHAEAASRGTRRTALTGRHPHYQERRAALLTLLANVKSRQLLWQTFRLFFGTLLRVLGLLGVRAVGQALDELAALLSIYTHPGQVRAARRERAALREHSPRDVSALRPPWWLPYRHGLDVATDLASALASSAQDLSDRRREAKEAALAAEIASSPALAPLQAAKEPRRSDDPDDDDAELYADSGLVYRFFTNPVALVLTLFVVLAVVAARAAFGEIQGGALSPVPQSAADWWRLHVESQHPLGTGSRVPAPAYVALFAVAGLFTGGNAGAVISVLMLLAVPIALWGAWRLLRLVGRLVDPRGLSTWVLVWGSVTYALVPATSGAWGEGRFGTVALAALLPWLAHAAIGFADPDAERRWRAAWRTGLLLALCSAFVPGVWLFGLLASALVVAAAFAISPRLLRERSAWGPPALALGLVPVLLLPWFLPLLGTGAVQGLLLEAGRLPVSAVDFTDLATGRLSDLGAPWWLGVPIGVLAVLAIAPISTRVPVMIGWLVALPAACVVAVLGLVVLDLPATSTPPSMGFFVVVLQGIAIVVIALGTGALVRRLSGDPHPWWQRAIAAVVAAVAVAVPLGGIVWWLGADNAFHEDRAEVVPAYMAQSSLTGDDHGVLVVRGSVDDGVTYRVRRGDGITVGEDEILGLTPEDREMTDIVTRLVSAPSPRDVEALAEHGIEYVVLPAPVDGRVSAGLDAVDGLVQASAEDRSTRAWRVDRETSVAGVASEVSAGRVLLLVIQGAAWLVALVAAAPTLVRSRSAA